jgi:hypothetical protein
MLVTACGTRPATPTAPPLPPLHLSPATDLAPAAGLAWLVDVDPRALAAQAELLPALSMLFPADSVAAFTERSGVDPWALEEVVVASYAPSPFPGEGDAEIRARQDTMLYLGRGAIQPGRIESIFRARAESVEGRAIDRGGDAPVIRTWGTVRGTRAQLATFGGDEVALEVGHFGPLRVAELFAEARLKRASPALKVEPLAHAAELVRDHEGDPPVRAFALGPFEGETATGLGGLLRAATAVAIGARPKTVKGHAAFEVVLVLTGGWGAEAKEAGERLRAAFDALSVAALGRLAGLDRPLGEVQVVTTPDALQLRVPLGALALARGARAAGLGGAAETGEIMSY